MSTDRIARWPWQRCKAVWFRGDVPVPQSRRCDLASGHECRHYSERGFDDLHWEERWTGQIGGAIVKDNYDPHPEEP
jgi:hypothetical protein